MFPGETIETGANNRMYGTNGYSNLKVMSSPAGHYLGTTFKDPEFGYTEPGSRETDYFSSQEEAVTALTQWHLGNKVGKR